MSLGPVPSSGPVTKHTEKLVGTGRVFLFQELPFFTLGAGGSAYGPSTKPSRDEQTTLPFFFPPKRI